MGWIWKSRNALRKIVLAYIHMVTGKCNIRYSSNPTVESGSGPDSHLGAAVN